MIRRTRAAACHDIQTTSQAATARGTCDQAKVISEVSLVRSSSKPMLASKPSTSATPAIAERRLLRRELQDTALTGAATSPMTEYHSAEGQPLLPDAR